MTGEIRGKFSAAFGLLWTSSVLFAQTKQEDRRIFPTKFNNPYASIGARKVDSLLIGSWDINPGVFSRIRMRNSVASTLWKVLSKTPPGPCKALRWESYQLIFINKAGHPIAAFCYCPVGIDVASAGFGRAEKQGDSYIFSSDKDAERRLEGNNYVPIPAALSKKLLILCRRHEAEQ